jgi:hypothetical protein
MLICFGSVRGVGLCSSHRNSIGAADCVALIKPDSVSNEYSHSGTLRDPDSGSDVGGFNSNCPDVRTVSSVIYVVCVVEAAVRCRFDASTVSGTVHGSTIDDHDHLAHGSTNCVLPAWNLRLLCWDQYNCVHEPVQLQCRDATTVSGAIHGYTNGRHYEFLHTSSHYVLSAWNVPSFWIVQDCTQR